MAEDFRGANAVMVATYHALFNGRSKFGISGSTRGPVDIAGIILDDAHTAFSNMRDIFSLCIERGSHQDLYDEITTLFRDDFGQQDRQGTYDDIIARRESHILEVPYISWINRSDEVRQAISELSDSDFPMVWALVRDSFKSCHALVSKDRVVITPFYPNVNLFPSFASCQHRIYMSATVADDSSIVRTFDAEHSSVANPISPTSLAGVGERMILIPEVVGIESAQAMVDVKKLVKEISSDAGVVVLTSSKASAANWSDVASVAVSDAVAGAVDSLVGRKSNGPFVFPSRYDGIDLPSDSCRLLVMSGLPRGTNDYDLFMAAVLEGGEGINASVAQRVEQGMGRGTRGSGDHCVVMLLGADLAAWVSIAANLALMTPTTQEQIEIGILLSNDVDSADGMREVIEQCLSRSPEWTQFHAESLADATIESEVDASDLAVARAERRFFRLLQAGHHSRAARAMQRFCNTDVKLDDKMKGWLLQLGARAAHLAGEPSMRDAMQRAAYANNRRVDRPVAGRRYTALSTPSRQADAIGGYVSKFALYRGAVIELDRVSAHLVSSATSNQFEEALKQFGEILGFVCERPDNEQEVGPDVLWILNDDSALIIEAKSRKKQSSRLTRDEHGQLLQSEEWFQTQYPDVRGVRVVVHPNARASRSVTVGGTQALTLAKLRELVGSARILLEELCGDEAPVDSLVSRCEARLEELKLTPGGIMDSFLVPFVADQRR